MVMDGGIQVITQVCFVYSLSSLSFLCDFFLSRDLRLDSRLFERRLRSDRSLLRERSLLLSD